MQREKIIPTILILLDIGVAIGYIPGGNWRMVVYWTAAATLTTVVTF